jgi:hypothetical protein
MTDRTIKSLAGATPQPGTGILHPFPTKQLPHMGLRELRRRVQSRRTVLVPVDRSEHRIQNIFAVMMTIPSVGSRADRSVSQVS